MQIVIRKGERRLFLLNAAGETVFSARVALGSAPAGPKERKGDGKTPEGTYFICLKKQGKYGPSLGVSYPSEADARRLGADEALIGCIRRRALIGERPPWGTFLGGEIYIHGGGAEKDWTAGCIALNDADAETLFALAPMGTKILILP